MHRLAVAQIVIALVLTACAEPLPPASVLGAWTIAYDAAPCAHGQRVEAFTLEVVDDVPTLTAWLEPYETAEVVDFDGATVVTVAINRDEETRLWLTDDGELAAADVAWSTADCKIESVAATVIERTRKD